MARPARKPEEVMNHLIRQVDRLNDEALWMFVRMLFPEADIDFLEDAFDSLTITRSGREPARPLEDVLRDLDKRHGIAR